MVPVFDRRRYSMSPERHQEVPNDPPGSGLHQFGGTRSSRATAIIRCVIDVRSATAAMPLPPIRGCQRAGTMRAAASRTVRESSCQVARWPCLQWDSAKSAAGLAIHPQSWPPRTALSRRRIRRGTHSASFSRDGSHERLWSEFPDPDDPRQRRSARSSSSSACSPGDGPGSSDRLMRIARLRCDRRSTARSATISGCSWPQGVCAIADSTSRRLGLSSPQITSPSMDRPGVTRADGGGDADQSLFTN